MNHTIVSWRIVALVAMAVVAGVSLLLTVLVRNRRERHQSQTKSGVGGVLTAFVVGAVLLLMLAIPAISFLSFRKDVEHSRVRTRARTRQLVETSSSEPSTEVDLAERRIDGPAERIAQLELPAELPADAPAWTRAGDQHGLSVVVGERMPSPERAEANAIQLASQILMSEYRKENPGSGTWNVDIEHLDTPAITKRYTKEVTWDFGKVPGSDAADTTDDRIIEGNVYRTYLQVKTNLHVKHAVFNQWQRQARNDRLESVTLTAGGFVGAIALLGLFFRIEKRGLVRRTARIATLLGAVGLGTASTLASADGLSAPTHTGPALSGIQGADRFSVANNDRHSEDAIAYADTGASKPSANFTAFLVHGNRVAFLVLGDEHLTESGKAEYVAKEIVECLDHFGSNINYRIVCQSESKVRNHDGHGQIDQEKLRETLESTFERGSEPAFPRTSVGLIQAFGPDEVVLIRDTKTKSCSGQRISGRKLTELFGTDIPVNVVEVGRRASKKDLETLSALTGGCHVVWDGHSTSRVSYHR